MTNASGSDSKVPKKTSRTRRPRPVHTATDFDLDVIDNENDLFRWFLLTYLLGKPIQSTVAVNTWKLFIDRKVDLPWTVLELSDRQLVSILHRGGYTRYQHVMTKAIKTAMRQLVDFYDGSLLLMIEASLDETELSMRLQKLYGVGPKTAEIFMKETEEFFARRVE